MTNQPRPQGDGRVEVCVAPSQMPRPSEPYAMGFSSKLYYAALGRTAGIGQQDYDSTFGRSYPSSRARGNLFKSLTFMIYVSYHVRWYIYFVDILLIK